MHKINNYLHIGTIVNVVGLKGQLKVKTFFSNIKTFSKVREVFNFDRKRKWKIKKVNVYDKHVILSFENLDTREDAELLKGEKLFINKDQLPKLKKNEYYLNELIGFSVLNKSGNDLGFVNNINNFGASDLIEVKQKNKKTFFLPFDENNIEKIKFKKKIIIANPFKGLIS